VAAHYFAGRLKELREVARLSQQELADRVGQTTRQISRLETGAQQPSWETALALADALGVDCRAFLEEPARLPQTGRGRPPKTAGKKSSPAAPKKQGQPQRGTEQPNS
jgi:transcriptional regulator with XRE-family HTH domain